MGLSELSGALLPALNEAMPHRLLPVLKEFLLTHAGARDVCVLLADYELQQLRVLSPEIGAELTMPVQGTGAGRCFVEQVPVTEAEQGGATVMVPLSLRAERLGVLLVRFEDPVVGPDLLRGLTEVALASAYVLVACGACSDVVEMARRAQPLSMAAEMQWSLQPLRAFSAPEFSIAGQLIPAYEVGGDCYDYNVDHGHLDLSSLDAMGHGVGASVLAALATAAMRNSRRTGGGPVEQVSLAARQLTEQVGGTQFVTALAMRLDLTDGHVVVVNAGHPPPWRVRAGAAEPLELDAQLPAGMFDDTTYEAQSLELEPGDRLVLVTDGVLEAGAPGPEFGAPRLQALLLSTAMMTPHQCVAEILRVLRGHTETLHDDATVICLDWLGP